MVDRRLSTLLDKATDPNLKAGPEWSAVNEFCSQVLSSQDGPTVALQLLLVKIQSTNENVAMMGLSVADSAMRNCGKTFHQEVGKFKFLNELIKLVSPKYDGGKTPSVVKLEIKQSLNKWSVGVPKEPKIAQALQMLRDQGLVSDSDFAQLETPQEREERMAPFEDKNKSELLARLLKSKHPEDLKAANRLIKEMVKQDDYKLQKLTRRLEVLETAKNNMKLLHDMLLNYEPGQSHDIVGELHRTCGEMRPKLFQLAQEMEEGDDGIGEVLVTSDDLNRVMNEYELVVVKGERLPRGPISRDVEAPPAQTLMSTSSATSERSDLDLLLDLGASPHQPTAVPSAHGPAGNTTSGASLLENELFALGLGETAPLPLAQPVQPPGIAQLFQTQQPKPLQPAASLAGGMVRPGAFQPLCAPVAPRLAPPPTGAPQQPTGLNLLGGLASFTTTQPRATTASVQIQQVPNLRPLVPPQANTTISFGPQQPAAVAAVPLVNAHGPGDTSSLAALDTLTIPLDKIQPGPHQPTIAYDKNGIRVLIYTAKDSPLPGVLVFVVSVSSALPQPVTNVAFQAAVPKTMRVKLQLPSGSELPAFNPIQPAQAVTQIMLLANPNREKIRLRYKVMYNIGKQQVTDMGEASEFPVQ